LYQQVDSTQCVGVKAYDGQMPDPVEALVLDLLAWVGAGRPYAEVMDAWRTSCPRLPVWEEANLRGYVHCERGQVTLMPAGRARLTPAPAPALPAARSSAQA
jgi:D-3-phosphoglycerate dehydrogenase